MFTGNKALEGTIYSSANSSVLFNATCKVIFHGNSALFNGGAVFSTHSNISFENSAYTEFSNNDVRYNIIRNGFNGGGAVHAHYTYVWFKGNSNAKFH